MIYIFGIISTIIMVVGMAGRGSSSNKITLVGGWLWLCSVVTAFILLGFKNGLFFLIGSLVLAALLVNLLKPILNPHGR